MQLRVERINDTGGTRIGWAIHLSSGWVVGFDDRHKIATDHSTLDNAITGVRLRSLDPAPGLSHGERDAAQVVEVHRWLENHGVAR